MRLDETHPGKLLWEPTEAWEPTEGRMRITRADPRVLISDELLRYAAQGSSPYMTVDQFSHALTVWDDFGAEFIYRVGAYLPEHNAWEARWPD